MFLVEVSKNEFSKFCADRLSATILRAKETTADATGNSQKALSESRGLRPACLEIDLTLVGLPQEAARIDAQAARSPCSWERVIRRIGSAAIWLSTVCIDSITLNCTL